MQSPITVYMIPKQPFYYDPDPLLGWGSRTSSTVETKIILHGRHRLLLREPYVLELAAALSQTFEQLRSPAPVTEAGQNGHVEVVGAP